MKTLYAVTSGEYSDYGVHFIVETRELAEQCVENLNNLTNPYNRYEIEEMTLLESIKETALKTEYWVIIDLNGNEVRSGVGRVHLWNLEKKTEVYDGSRAGIRAASTRSAAAALKAARDRLARYKAEQAGVATP